MAVDQTSSDSSKSEAPPKHQRDLRLRVGDRVRVADAKTILESLDSNSRCDGLPFMPQMTAYCGQQLTVTRWVNNVCVQESDGMYFGNLSDTVILNTQRCNGVAQGGCQMACPLMWKTKWLQPESDGAMTVFEPGLDSKKAKASCGTSAAHQTLVGLANQATESPATESASCVSCQATELYRIAPPRSKKDIAQYMEERNLNRVSAAAIASSFCGGILARIRGQQNGLIGTLKITPRVDLNLEPGEFVRVRSQAEIIQTLDREGKNRGLWFDPVMLRYCGQRLAVSKRITRIVDESSGRLLNLKTPSIVLEDLHCQPSDRRFCSRLLHLFWREIWLEREPR